MRVAAEGHDGTGAAHGVAAPQQTSGEVRALQGAPRVASALDHLLVRANGEACLDYGSREFVEAMEGVTSEARAIGLQPEELLLLLKSSWRAHPPIRRFGRADTSEEQLTRLVTLCIKSYFAERVETTRLDA